MALVPILLYHAVTEQPHPVIRGFAVDRRTFAAHLDLIVERGLASLTVSEYLDAVDRDDDALLARAVVLTFDDGFADVRTAALPELERRGLRATLYVTTGTLRGGPAPPLDGGLARAMLAWDELAGLHRSGVELGAHSHAHPHLDTLRRARARDEVLRSRRLVAEASGAEVATFAYPHGYSSPWLRRAVRDAGFRGACGVQDALSSPQDDRFALARLMVRDTTPRDTVAAWLDRRGAPRHHREALRTRGWRAYRRGRAIVTRRPGADQGWPVGTSR